MKWELRRKSRGQCSYKTMYISDSLVEKINKIAYENDTSFNNVVISMIESCVDEDVKENNV
ncbi:MAG: hypothetical protein FWH07_04085 [Oscillospiraceae bacterium]|nr:hypothetical protein [Oscillospiraceae bacterium]